MESKDWLKSFSEEEYRAHIKKIQEELKKENLDMMLLCNRISFMVCIQFIPSGFCVCS